MYDNNYPNTNPTTDSNTTNSAANSTTVNPSADSAAVNPASTSYTSQGNNNTVPNQRQSWNQGLYGGPNTGCYYQNTYRNTAYTQNPAGSPYEKHAGNYQYGNTYPNDYAQMNQNKDKKVVKKKKAHGGFLKKALICVSLGLVFGIFAGLGWYGVQSVTGMIGQDTEEERVLQEVPDVETISGEVANESVAETRVPDVESSVVTVVSDVSDVVEEVMPAIVAIDNHYTEKISYWGQSFSQEADASCSGIIVGQNDTELLIVTNYHVIADTERLTVQFVEGSKAEASVKGTDAEMDLAVIAVPIDSIDKNTRQVIAVATLGDSDALKVGEPAIAIGNSLGYGQSVTTGVISALNRTIELSDGSDGTFIQTDAAINPGNSGGALLNVKGEVIGINSNKIGGSAIEGMGYAIPISSASPIIAELMLKETKNKVAEEERGYLGITGISVTEDVEMYGIPKGVFITQVYDNTAASAAGLKKGDIITELDGERISSMDELQKELEFHATGETVEITIMTASNSGYVSRSVQLTLGSRVQN